MKRLLIIGIGAGDPDHLTFQGAKAIAAADVFFILDKGEVKDELVRLRERLIEEHGSKPYRIVQGRDPERDRTSPAYADAVADWRSRRAEVCAELIRDELPDGGTGAFLVWGDPGVYDSTLAIVHEIRDRGLAGDLEHEVVPGISSVAALTARHGIGLTRVGRPAHLTTGRRLAAEGPAADTVVMLDAHCAFAGLDERDLGEHDIYWGAYLGTPDEILVSGPVAEVAERIRTVRAEARARKGWIMDTYLLRRRSDGMER